MLVISLVLLDFLLNSLDMQLQLLLESYMTAYLTFQFFKHFFISSGCGILAVILEFGTICTWNCLRLVAIATIIASVYLIETKHSLQIPVSLVLIKRCFAWLIQVWRYLLVILAEKPGRYHIVNGLFLTLHNFSIFFIFLILLAQLYNFLGSLCQFLMWFI